MTLATGTSTEATARRTGPVALRLIKGRRSRPTFFQVSSLFLKRTLCRVFGHRDCLHIHLHPYLDDLVLWHQCRRCHRRRVEVLEKEEFTRLYGLASYE